MERPEGETQPRAIPFLNIGGDDGDGDDKRKTLRDSLFSKKEIAEKMRKSIFGPFGVILGHFGSFLVHFGSFWVILGPFWAIWGHIWATLGHFGSFLATLDHYGSF